MPKSARPDDDLALDRLSDADLALFGRTFLATWMGGGFGSLAKRDTELLVFACLERVLAQERSVSNFEWAKTLKLTPRRVKSLRLNAHLRYGDVLGSGGAFAHAERFFRSVESITLELDASNPALDGRVRLLVEDPVVLMEVEEAVKAMQGIVHHERNREVIAVGLEHFLRLVAIAAETGEEDLIPDLAHRVVHDSARRSAAQSELAKASYKQLSEGRKLERGLRRMLEVVAEKELKLFDQLKAIIDAQKYHGTFRGPDA